MLSRYRRYLLCPSLIRRIVVVQLAVYPIKIATRHATASSLFTLLNNRGKPSEYVFNFNKPLR